MPQAAGLDLENYPLDKAPDGNVATMLPFGFLPNGNIVAKLPQGALFVGLKPLSHCRI